MWKVLLFVLCIPHWPDTRDILNLWYRAVWQICTNISEYPPPPSSGWWRQQVPLRHVTYLPAYSGWTKVTSNIVITTLRTSDLYLYDTQQVLEISTKIWWIWDCKFRYIIVVCVSSLIVSVSVNKSEGVVVCLW